MLQFLFFTQPSSSNGLEDITCNRPRTGVARPKNRVKFDPDGQNIDFFEKFWTVTLLFFAFQGGLPFWLFAKKWPKTLKRPFFSWKLVSAEGQNQHRGSCYRHKYWFWSKMLNGNVVQFVKWNNFCIYTFFIGHIALAAHTIATLLLQGFFTIAMVWAA